jgi:hypothetical protein
VTRRTIKKLLLSLIAIGILASFTTGGVYAVMSSDTQNASGIIASATFTMSNTVGAGSPCSSQSGTGNSNLSCSALVSAATANLPGNLTQVHVTLTNTGSTPGYGLGVSMPGASAGAGCAESNSTSPGAVIGGGHPCGATGDLFYIQEMQSDFSTPVNCWYPSSAGTTCAITSGGTLNGFSQSYYWGPSSLAAPKLDLGTDGTSRHGLDAQKSRYFVVGIQEGTDNTLQGVVATFSLLWHVDSAP